MADRKLTEVDLVNNTFDNDTSVVIQNNSVKQIPYFKHKKKSFINAIYSGLSPSNSGIQNSNALQTIIDSLSTSGGGIVYIPSGEYQFASAGNQTIGEHCIRLKSNICIEGDGISTVLLPTGATEKGLDMFYYNELTDSTNTQPLRNCIFKNFTIDGKNTSCASYTSAGKGFMINIFENCHWKNVVVKNTDATGFGVDCPIDSSITKCVAENCGKAAQITDVGASGFGIGFGYSYNENLYISQCRSSGNKKFGFFFEHQRRFDSEKYTATNNKGFIVSECTADGNYNNFGGVQAINTQYRNCFSSTAVNHGYFFENSNDCNVIGCYSVMEGNTSFVILSSDTDGGTQEVKDISYNQCISKYTSFGAKIVQYGSTAAMTRNLIKDCYFDATITNSVYTSGTMESLILQGNVHNNADNNFEAIISTFTNKYNSWN